jgi:hypothetical protein
MKIFVLYENPDWLPPLVRELNRAGLPHEEWFIQTGSIDLDQAPPEGIFLNRMSPSSHTRGHLESVDYMREMIAWLESYDRRVINGSQAFALEISKVRQYAALRRSGIRTPHTVAVSGYGNELKRAARQMPLPFITKHNRGGKGLGVQLFRALDAFDGYVESADFEIPRDHITLLQEYIEPKDPFITRVEIVNGKFLYAIKSDTRQGFQLCPAERCEPGDAFCPAVDQASVGANRQNLFELREEFDDPIVDLYIQFMRKNEIDLAGIEFIEDRYGNKVTYDVNGTTNYSPGVEEKYGLNGMANVASFLARELKSADCETVII